MGLELDGVNGIIKNTTSDGDVTIKGNDGGSEISLLTFDVSAQGTATFNSTVTTGGLTTTSDLTLSDSTPLITLTDTDDNTDCLVYQAGGDLYLEADKNTESSNSFMSFGVDDVKIAKFSTAEAVFNDDSNDIDFRVESNANTHAFFLEGSTGNIGIGTSSIDVSTQAGGSGYRVLQIENDEGGQINLDHNDAGTGSTLGQINFQRAGEVLAEIEGVTDGATDSGRVAFRTQAASGALTERMRIDSSGNVLVAKTSNSGGNTVGIQLQAIGQGLFTRDGGTVMNITRNSDDGELMKFIQDGSLEGTISVSGTTVSFSGFTGSHWSRLADNSKPTIFRGTIMESIDEMCDWYQAVAGEIKEPIALGDKSVGDAITFTSNGTEYTGTIVKEGDVKHTKCKVSDTADSKKVYGVFSNWDDQDDGLDGDVNDMNIAQVGTYIIRVNKDVTVSAGDLLVSNGDGTAKKQDDDIIRSKTVAKVNSNIKVETYSDGSYTVPCTLHC